MRATAGDDSKDGLSWANAWQTVQHMDSMVHDSGLVVAGDSIIFGAGRYLESMINPPINSDFANLTVYIDSSYLNGGDPYGAQINGGYDIPTWVSYNVNGDTNIWAAKFDPSVECWYTALVRGKLLTLVQDDSLLFYPLDNTGDVVGDVDDEGDMWNDSALDSIYAWIYGDADPNDMEMLIACWKCIGFNGQVPYGGAASLQSHVLFKGLDIKLGDNLLVGIYTGADSIIFEHCLLGYVGGSYANNPAIILSTGDHPTDPAEDLTIKACSLYNIHGHASGSNHQGQGVGGYLLRRALIESTYIAPSVQSTGIDWKMGDNWPDADDYSDSSIFRYNIIEPAGGPGIWLSKQCKDNFAYGNIIRNISGYGTEHKAHVSGLSSNTVQNLRGGNRYYNNTYYNANIFFEIQAYHWVDGDQNTIKYNVFYDIANASRQFYDFSTWGGDANGETPRSWTYYDIDSNYYYDPDGAFAVDLISDGAGSLLVWSEWQTLGFDVNSSNSDPGLDSVDAFNAWLGMARSGASGEMDTTYGGKTWTVWGAVQPDTSISQVLDTASTGQTTIEFTDAFTLQNVVVDSAVFEVSDDAWSSTEYTNTVDGPANPQADTATGLVANTEYVCRVRAFYNEQTDDVDTSNVLTITTDSAEESPTRYFPGKRQ